MPHNPITRAQVQGQQFISMLKRNSFESIVLYSVFWRILAVVKIQQKRTWNHPLCFCDGQHAQTNHPKVERWISMNFFGTWKCFVVPGLNLGKGIERKENTIELQLYSKHCPNFAKRVAQRILYFSDYSCDSHNAHKITQIRRTD